jgi:bleomycin hydrolase
MRAINETGNNAISDAFVAKLRTEFDSNKSAKVIQNAVTAKAVNELALDFSQVQTTTHCFTTKLDDWAVTNQKSSGRCWLFALLNLFRPGAMKKLNVKDFEFSQAHIHFWDKFERANCFLEAVIETSMKDVDDRTVAYILGDPIGDGGQWNMALNLVRKHGLVPKWVYPESHSSSATGQMNARLKDLLRTSASQLRHMINKEDGASLAEARKFKEMRMADVWRLLCIHLGTPPEEFELQWQDKDKNVINKGVLTPLQFATEYVEIEWYNYGKFVYVYVYRCIV